MSFLSLVGIEFKKIRRSKILLLLIIPLVLLWIPAVTNAGINFSTQPEGISPKNNFLIQSFMGMAGFMFPASLVVCTVLLNQTERSGRGILKMLSLPIDTFKMCMAKFVLLLMLAALQMVMMVGMYFVCAAIASEMQNYNFILSPAFVLKEAGMMYLSAIPMIAVYWMLSTCIQTPIFSVGIGLASIVPSILMINTKVWFAYPMCYPFYVITAEYGKLAKNLKTWAVQFVPWLPIALVITILCLAIACIRFGQAERR